MFMFMFINLTNVAHFPFRLRLLNIIFPSIAIVHLVAIIITKHLQLLFLAFHLLFIPFFLLRTIALHHSIQFQIFQVKVNIIILIDPWIIHDLITGYTLFTSTTKLMDIFLYLFHEWIFELKCQIVLKTHQKLTYISIYNLNYQLAAISINHIFIMRLLAHRFQSILYHFWLQILNHFTFFLNK